MAHKKPADLPPEHLPSQPGSQAAMRLQPQSGQDYQPAGKLRGKVALITGGDSGIGRAVALLFAKEGADIAIAYLSEDRDAEDTRRLIEAEGHMCLTFKGDVGDPVFCWNCVSGLMDNYRRLDILVNNAGEQHEQTDFSDITRDQLERTFKTNVFAMFYMAKAALPHLQEGSAIINTTSVTAYKGNPVLIDYSATKGAIVAFTRSLSLNLASRHIRVNAVAPGPIWTPLIPATFPPEKVDEFGKDVPLGRPGQPEEVAPAYVYLASEDSSYVTGQVIHVNGGSIING